jgi:hypothetical protein
MKCESDFDNEDQTLLRQADECVEPWWEGDKPAEQQKTAETPPAGQELVEEEALRRGLLKKDEEGNLCLACDEKKSE